MISLRTAEKSGKMAIADMADKHGSDNQQIKLAFRQLPAIR